MASPASIAAYLVLFASVAAVFVAANLVIGRFLRPHAPSAAKGETYECGEPVIGSSFVQFDIRFYVVALLFIIFDVEVAFFFPWAIVFGKATQITAAANQALANTGETAESWMAVASTKAAELGVAEAGADPTELAEAASQLSTAAFFDLAIFFGVLMVGFAYAWRRGDLDWVRTTINRPLTATDTAAAA